MSQNHIKVHLSLEKGTWPTLVSVYEEGFEMVEESKGVDQKDCGGETIGVEAFVVVSLEASGGHLKLCAEFGWRRRTCFTGMVGNFLVYTAMLVLRS